MNIQKLEENVRGLNGTYRSINKNARIALVIPLLMLAICIGAFYTIRYTTWPWYPMGGIILATVLLSACIVHLVVCFRLQSRCRRANKMADKIRIEIFSLETFLTEQLKRK